MMRSGVSCGSQWTLGSVLLRPEQILNCPPSLPPWPCGQLPLAQPRFTVCPSCQAQQEQVGGLSGLKHRDGVSGAKQPKKQPQTSGSEVRTQVRQVMVVVGG